MSDHQEDQSGIDGLLAQAAVTSGELTDFPGGKEQNQAVFGELVRSSKFTQNVGQDFISTTADKIKLAIAEHDRASRASVQWPASLGLVLSLLVAIAASDFKNPVLSVPANVVHAAFLFGLLASFVWFVVSAMRAWRYRGQTSGQEFVKRLKRGSDESGETRS